MHLKLPHALHYPITVLELLKQPGDNVEKSTPIFSYKYRTTVEEGDRSGNITQVEKDFPARFESSVEGTLKKWHIKAGAVISHAGLDVAEFDEACDHSVQYGGICAICGKDMTEVSFVTNQRDASRAPINMIHDNIALTVSENEATKVEEEAKRRLIKSKKLSLVVDLDQTIIHATVDPTVAEWQKDPTNPNHDAVKDVRAFQLVDDGPGARGCWYYIKLRPGLAEFLDNVSKIYELHIYTMGTRAYAQHIAEIVDPDRKIFGDRILSRDESGSLVAKNLQRLFPVDTKMVVIIDDRGDVWKWNDNLVKVTPYDFFIGIGDINSSFLPSKQGMKATPKPMASKHHTEGATVKEPETRPNGEVLDTSGAVENRIELSADGQISALEQLVSMGGGDDPVVLEAQTIKQDELIAAQLSDRPLLQKQKRLEEEEAASEALAKTGGDIAMETEKPRHNLLQDLDNELFYLERSLRIVHAEFFDTYAKKLAATHGGRIAELRGGSSGNRRPAASVNLDLEMIPDVKSIMPSIKMRVLDGVVIVFSGVVPLGIDVQSSDVALWAKSFGAKVSDKVTKRTTHLIAARNRTQKVRQAAMWGQNKIKIVGTQWLMDSIVRWEKLDEEPYKMKTDEGEAGKHVPGEEDEILSDSESAASALDTDNESEGGSKSKSNLRLTIKVNAASEVADEEDLEDVMPGEMMEDAQSPMGGSKVDWDHMKEELDEWIGDSGDDDSEDGESLVSGEGEQNSEPVRKAKRSYEEMGGYGDKDESPDRKKLALQKGISQSQESADNLGLPTPDVTVEEGEDGAEETGGDADSDDGWGDLEGDLAQEMQRAVDENDRERGED